MDAAEDDWRRLPRPHEAQGALDATPTIPAILARAVARFGDLPFLADDDAGITFAQADRRSAALARGLLAIGAGKGTRIGLMMPNGADWVLAWLAIARIGAIAVGFSTLYQRRELDWALRHNDIDTLLVSAGSGLADVQMRLEGAVPGLADCDGALPMRLASHPYLRRILVWHGEPRGWAGRGPDALHDAAAAAPAIDAGFLASIEAQVSPADDLAVICTSGTTAEPKAVISTHGQAVRSTWSFTPYTLFGQGEPVYNGLPFFWVGGLLRGLMPSLFTGACQCFPRSFAGDDLVDMLVRHRVTTMYAIPAHLHTIRSAAARRGIDLSFVREGLVPFVDHRTGTVIAEDSRPGGSIGMSETFGTHSSEAQDLPTPPGKAGNWGRPMPGVERRIADPETGEVLPPGARGELHLRGSTLMRGYNKRERHETFTPDGYLRTGDMAMIDEDDFLFFYGRTNDLIKTSGANVAPAEVEAVLSAFPEVREAIVFGMPDRAKGEVVAAVVVPEDGCEIDVRDLKRRVRSELSSYKAPVIVVTMAWDEVPRTDAAAKPKRAALRAMLQHRVERSIQG